MPFNQVDGRVQTVGAQTVVVASTPLDQDRVILVEGWVIGRDTVNGQGAAFKANASGKTVGAVASLVGAIVPILSNTDAGLAAASASFNVAAGGVLELRVTGVAGRTIRWNGEMVIHVIG